MVIFDSCILLYSIFSETSAPIDPTTEKPLIGAKERVEHLITQLSKSRTKIIIPTPVLSEVLLRTNEATERWVDIFNRHGAFRIAPFCQRSAIELALLNRVEYKRAERKGDTAGTKAKLKFDRQIVAVARANRVQTIYTDDNGLKSHAATADVKTVSSWELPLPPEDRQINLQLPSTDLER